MARTMQDGQPILPTAKDGTGYRHGSRGWIRFDVSEKTICTLIICVTAIVIALIGGT